MKKIPILFTDENVLLIEDRKKKQTRRLSGLKKINKDPDAWSFCAAEVNTEGELYFYFKHSDGSMIDVRSPYGKPGDILWIRQTWKWEGDTSWRDAMRVGSFWFKADIMRDNSCGPAKWKPSIHMPFVAAKNFVTVLDVSVERLLDITEDDAMAEGVHFDHDSGYWFLFDRIMEQSATDAYFKLWDELNPELNTNFNPWVFKVTFRLNE